MVGVPHRPLLPSLPTILNPNPHTLVAGEVRGFGEGTHQDVRNVGKAVLFALVFEVR